MLISILIIGIDCKLKSEEMNNEQRIRRDLKRMVGAWSVVVLSLLGIIMFSPLASRQYDDAGLARGSSSNWEIDSLMMKKDYQGALRLVDKMIAEKEEDLPRFAFFDRYLSKDKRYDAALARVAISQLKRKRTEIMRAMETNSVK